MRPCRARAARSYFLVEGSSCGGMLLGSGDDFARSFNRSNSPSDNGVPCIGAPRGSPPSESFALSGELICPHLLCHAAPWGVRQPSCLPLKVPVAIRKPAAIRRREPRGWIPVCSEQSATSMPGAGPGGERTICSGASGEGASGCPLNRSNRHQTPSAPGSPYREIGLREPLARSGASATSSQCPLLRLESSIHQATHTCCAPSP